MSVVCGFCIKFTDRERLSCHNSECARRHTTFYNMTVLVFMDWIMPLPGVKCHGQERERYCGETGDSHLGGHCPRRAHDLFSTELLWLTLVLVTEVLFRTVSFVCFFFPFLLWIGISPWQMILCPNCPKVTSSHEISRAVSVGAEPKVEACILISYGLSSLMKRMVVVGHLTLAFFCSFCQ